MGENLAKENSRTIREDIFRSYMAPWRGQTVTAYRLSSKGVWPAGQKWGDCFTPHKVCKAVSEESDLVWGQSTQDRCWHSGESPVKSHQSGKGSEVHCMRRGWKKWSNSEIKPALSRRADQITFGSIFQAEFCCDPMSYRIKFKSQIFTGPIEKKKQGVSWREYMQVNPFHNLRVILPFCRQTLLV